MSGIVCDTTFVPMSLCIRFTSPRTDAADRSRGSPPLGMPPDRCRAPQRLAQEDEKVIDLDALTDLSENSCPNPNVRRSAPNMAQGPDSPE
jgi:hypothetical protein